MSTNIRIPKNTLALAFVSDMTAESVKVITHEDQFRGHSFSRVVWLKTPTIHALNTARASVPENAIFGWLCNKPDMFLSN